ncbi:MAG: peptidoglycan editing factor PgeF [Pseudomonadota bacterium]
MIDYIEYVFHESHPVKVVSTRRSGGFSQFPFDGLNLGEHVGDRPADVTKNRDLLLKEFGSQIDVVYLNQVHGTNIIHAEQSGIASADGMEADGAVTSVRNIACAIMTADCLPLVLTNRSGTQVMTLHVGWRGLQRGIVQKGVALFEVEPSEIMAWAGPCIGTSAFEVGAEVKQQLQGPPEAWRLKDSKLGKWLCDLTLLTKYELSLQGVNQFSSAGECTFSSSKHYFSYRRDGQTGRQATLAWIS